MTAHEFKHLRIEYRGPATVICFIESVLVDHEMVTAVGQELLSAHDLSPESHFIVSFAGVEAISSAGIGKLITLNRRAHRHECLLLLCDMEADVAELFVSSRLDTYFQIFTTLAEALEHAGDAAG